MFVSAWVSLGVLGIGFQTRFAVTDANRVGGQAYRWGMGVCALRRRKRDGRWMQSDSRCIGQKTEYRPSVGHYRSRSAGLFERGIINAQDIPQPCKSLETAAPG